jgi:hypothetical protein
MTAAIPKINLTAAEAGEQKRKDRGGTQWIFHTGRGDGPDGTHVDFIPRLAFPLLPDGGKFHLIARL